MPATEAPVLSAVAQEGETPPPFARGLGSAGPLMTRFPSISSWMSSGGQRADYGCYLQELLLTIIGTAGTNATSHSDRAAITVACLTQDSPLYLPRVTTKIIGTTAAMSSGDEEDHGRQLYRNEHRNTPEEKLALPGHSSSVLTTVVISKSCC